MTNIYGASHVFGLPDLLHGEYGLTRREGETISGAECTAVRVMYHGNWYADLYFEVKSALFIAIDRNVGRPGDNRITRRIYRDFKDYNGLFLPSASSSYVDNQFLTDEFLDAFEKLPLIPDSDFEIPAGLQLRN